MSTGLEIDNQSIIPFFVYGTLKPDEIAFYQIKELIENVKPAQLKDYALYLRDGIPVIFKTPNWSPLNGFLIWPKTGKQREVNEILNKYEGERLYLCEKVVAVCENKNVDCLTYVGRNAMGSHAEPLHGSWFGRDDTIFNQSFPSLYKNIVKLIEKDISSGPDIDDWDYYNELTSKYLLLITIIERLAYLFCGEVFTVKDIKNGQEVYNDRIMQRIVTLGKCSQFQDAYKEVEKKGFLNHVEIFDSRDAKKSLNSKQSKKALETWYQVRSNLQHRGKSAWRDVKTVRDSLVSLANIMFVLLPKLLPGIDKSYSFQELETYQLIKLNKTNLKTSN